MYCYVDESGNTGLELFDSAQPTLYYGLLLTTKNLDIVAEPLLAELRTYLGVARIHASQLGVGRLTFIAEKIARFSKRNDLRFSLLRVQKPDHAIISFFDQVFDSGMNKAVSWMQYSTPMRYLLLVKVAHLFDEPLARRAWAARRERNPSKCAGMLKDLCNDILPRVERLPDARSRELISGALRWAAANPEEISYGVGNYDTALQISPNLVGFQQVLQTIALESFAQKRRVIQITVDRQIEFNRAQEELAEFYQRLRGHKVELGPGMPKFDFSLMPEIPPTFVPGDASAGLELVDITLWIAKRMSENRSLTPELKTLFWSQARRGRTDEVSLHGIESRWAHLLQLPDRPVPDEVMRMYEESESRRKAEVGKIEG